MILYVTFKEKHSNTLTKAEHSGIIKTNIKILNAVSAYILVCWFWVFAAQCWLVLFKISISILIWIRGELAGRWSVAVAVAVSDMWQVTCGTQHATPDRWHQKPDNIYIYFLVVFLATIYTCWEIQCLLYASFFSLGNIAWCNFCSFRRSSLPNGSV